MQKLQALRRAEGADYRSAQGAKKSKCFPGTREAVLREIKIWMKDTDKSSQRIYWLDGIAGIGKSTIAISVAIEAVLERLVCASFFCSRGTADLTDPRLLMPTLAHQLARINPAYCYALAKALDGEVDVGLWGAEDQVKKLFIEAMNNVKWAHEPILLVVDALDECTEGIQTVIEVLLEVILHLPVAIKVFVTSRPDPCISAVLTSQSRLHKFVLHNEIEASVVNEDIELYLRARLDSIPKEIGWNPPKASPLQSRWFSETQLRTLVEQSGILFIYAYTATFFIGDKKVRNPPKQLQILVKNQPTA